MSSRSPVSQNIFEQHSRVSSEERARLFRQRGCVVWFTGLPGSGKSTLAQLLEQELVQTGHPAFILDGDNIRRGLNSDLGFTDKDRHENIRRVAEAAALFADAGLICIAAFISPFVKDRQRAREAVGTDRFVEVYISTPLEVCEQRDPKGLYRKARQGQIKHFTGLTSPYEPPSAPELELNTAGAAPADSIRKIMETLRTRGLMD
jgi:adenylyl-sulfate kinase